MKEYQFRIGEGEVKVFKAMGPTQREDGTPLSPDEISHYNRYLRYYDPADGRLVGEETVMRVELIEDASTPEYDGQFDEVVYIDDVATAGVYEYDYTTVDTGARESVRSEIIRMVVLPPFALPLPPDVS